MDDCVEVSILFESLHRTVTMRTIAGAFSSRPGDLLEWLEQLGLVVRSF